MKNLLLAVVILCLGFLACTQNDTKWERLFNGKDLTYWKIVGSTGVAEVKDSTIASHMTVNTREHTFICTQQKFGDFILELDVKTDSGYNSGILLRSIDKPPNCDTCKVSLYGYQVKIDPSPRAWTGGVFLDYGSSWHWLYDLSHDERARKAYHIGEWNHFRIEAIGPSIKVWVNDIPTTNMINSRHTNGYIALKIHSLGDEPEKEKMVGRFKNFRILTQNLSEHTKSMDIPAKTVD